MFIFIKKKMEVSQKLSELQNKDLFYRVITVSFVKNIKGS